MEWCVKNPILQYSNTPFSRPLGLLIELFDQSHQSAPYSVSMSRKIRFRGRSANVGKLETLLEIRRGDQYAMRHRLGQFDDSRRGRKAADSSRAEGTGPFRCSADL